MIELLLFSFSVSLICLTVHVVLTWDGMIFFEAGEYLTAIFGPVTMKPFFGCLICMCSVWSIAFWFITGHSFEWNLIPAILITGGFNTLWSCLLSLTEEHGW